LADRTHRPPGGGEPGAADGAAAAITRAADDDAVRIAIAAQDEAGLEPITDGRLRWSGPFDALRGLGGLAFATNSPGGRLADPSLAPTAVAEPTWRGPLTVEDWRFAAASTTKAVKQALPGPYTLGRRVASGDLGRDRLTNTLAEALNVEIHALASAGCPLIEIDEPDAVLIDDEVERRRFGDAHRRLTDGATIHLSLALTGGNAKGIGVDTVFDSGYASLAVDLIAGPDNWRLVTRAPGDRGIVCGVLSARRDADDGPEVLVWAAHYAASSGGRGIARVGLAAVPGMEALDWDRARSKLARLGEAARLAAVGSAAELAAALDPRAVSSRSAALGTVEPPRRSGKRRSPGRSPGSSKR